MHIQKLKYERYFNKLFFGKKVTSSYSFVFIVIHLKLAEKHTREKSLIDVTISCF